MSDNQQNSKPDGTAPKSTKKSASKLGRGLSSLMQDISPAIENIDQSAAASPAQPTQAVQKPAPNSIPTVSPITDIEVEGRADQAKSEHRGIYAVPIERLERNPNQPRRYFDPKLLQELTHSIRDKGILQPILVRPLPARAGSPDHKFAHYQIVAGERRWQASVNAGLSEMPVLVRDLSDQEVLEIGVVENVQRANLNPIEEAMAYQALKDQFGRRQEDIADAVGKSRSHVANCLRLLSLPERARELVHDGKLSAGHARAILSSHNPHGLSELIVSKGWSVREAEKYVRNERKAIRASEDKPERQEADTRFIEQQLFEHLGLKIKINHKGPGGQVGLQYRSLEELEDLITRLKAT